MPYVGHTTTMHSKEVGWHTTSNHNHNNACYILIHFTLIACVKINMFPQIVALPEADISSKDKKNPKKLSC